MAAPGHVAEDSTTGLSTQHGRPLNSAWQTSQPSTTYAVFRYMLFHFWFTDVKYNTMKTFNMSNKSELQKCCFYNRTTDEEICTASIQSEGIRPNMHSDLKIARALQSLENLNIGLHSSQSFAHYASLCREKLATKTAEQTLEGSCSCFCSYSYLTFFVFSYCPTLCLYNETHEAWIGLLQIWSINMEITSIKFDMSSGRIDWAIYMWANLVRRKKLTPNEEKKQEYCTQKCGNCDVRDSRFFKLKSEFHILNNMFVNLDIYTYNNLFLLQML